MPKKEWKIERFDGGINRGASKRDLQINELVEAKSISIGSHGLVKCGGSLQSHSMGTSPTFADSANTTLSSDKGRGLFRFASDYSIDVTIDTNADSEEGTEHDDQGGFLVRVNVDTDFIDSVSDGDTVVLAGWSSLDGIYTISGREKNPSGNYFDLDDTTYSSNESGSVSTISTFTERDTNFLGFIGAGGRLSLYDDGVSSWVLDRFDVSTTSTTEPIIYTVDGSIRISDGNFDTSANTKHFGYLNRTFFKNGVNGQSSTEYSVNNWFLTDQNLDKPTGLDLSYQYYVGTGQEDDLGETTYTGISYGDVFVRLTALHDSTLGTGVDSTTGWEAKWNIAVSYVYEGNQESPLTYRTRGDSVIDFITEVGGTAPAIYGVDVQCGIKTDSANKIDSRITGINVYAREDGADTWWQIGEFDITNGGVSRDVSVDGYTGWRDHSDITTNKILWSPTGRLRAFPLIKSFEMSSGFDSETTRLTARFKTATVLGRVAWIGNVKMFNPDKGAVEVMGDTMIKTQPGKFDTFLLDNKSVASINDGESIVHIEGFNDRILQFKKHTLYIINVASDYEYIEQTHINKGVEHSASVCKNDMGISWANKEGVFHYDGEKVLNLFESKGVLRIPEDDWKKFREASKGSGGATMIQSVGYNPEDKTLIVVDTIASNTNGGEVYVFSFKTGGWVFYPAGTFNVASKSNFILGWDDTLLHGYQSGDSMVFKKWDHTPVDKDDYLFETKDITFDSNSKRKRIYSIYVTHRNAGTDKVKLSYKILDYSSGEGSWTGAVSLTEHSTAANWTTQRIVVNANDVLSMQLKVYQAPDVGDPPVTHSVPAGFEINDINIVYRDVSLK